MDEQVVPYHEAVNHTLTAVPPECKLDDDILEQGFVEKARVTGHWKGKAYEDYHDSVFPQYFELRPFSSSSLATSPRLKRSTRNGVVRPGIEKGI